MIGPTHPLCPHDSCWQIKLATARPSNAKLGPEQLDGAVVTWLSDHVVSIRLDEAATAIYRDVTSLARQVETAIDNYNPGIYAGPCDAPDAKTTVVDGTVYVVPGVCGADLMARTGEPKVVCDVCGYTYDVIERQEFMREAARDVWLRPAVIVDVLRAWGVDISFANLKNWIARDKAEFDNEKPRRVQYPPILMVSSDALDDAGRPLMEPDLDEDGAPRLNRLGQQIMRPVGRPKYRLGDVMDRVVALKEIAELKVRRSA